jgi:hypothetical protein
MSRLLLAKISRMEMVTGKAKEMVTVTVKAT